MAERHLSHDDFFTGLTELFNARQGKDHGSIHLTQKRFSSSGDSSSAATPPKKSEEDKLLDLNPPEPLPIIIRATNGKGSRAKDKKVKLSTIVQPTEIETFFTRYSELCKAGMKSLRPRDRKARRKDKAKKKKVPAEGEVKT